MKTPSSDLHELIRSLSPSEKRYFKLQSSLQAGDKAYTNLFDAISSQEKFDEEELKKKLKKDAVLGYLPKAKHKLYRLILKTLRNFHADTSVSVEIKNNLLDLEILSRKGLFKQCKKLISSVKKTIYNYEKYELLPYTLMWETSVLNKSSDFEKQDKIAKEAKANLELLENINDYSRINSRLGLLGQKTGLARSTNDLKEIEQLIKDPLMANWSNARSLRAKQSFCAIYAFYYFLKRDMPNTLIHIKKRVQLYESSPAELHKSSSHYISAVANLMATQYHLFEEQYTKQIYNDFVSTLQKIKTIKPGSKYEEIMIFRAASSAELSMHIKTGNFEQGLLTVSRVEAGIIKYKSDLNEYNLLIIYWGIIVVYFGAQKYRDALRTLNILLNQDEQRFGQDIYCFAKLFNLIIHLELGNESFINSTLKSTYHYFSKRKRLYKFEKIVLTFLKKISSASGDKREMLSAYKELRTELIELLKDPYERSVFQNFDLILWLESKMEQRPFAEMVRERFLADMKRKNA